VRTVEEYERNQEFNPVVTWLHSFRYRRILRVLSQLPLQRIRLLDIGCGHAKLYAVLDTRFDIEYMGIDTTDYYVRRARERYGTRSNFQIIHESAVTAIERTKPDVVVALETLEHVHGHEAVRIVEQIAALRPLRFLCSVPVEIGPAIWLKNIGSLLCGYSRHTEYTWPETFWSGLYQLDRIPPHSCGHKGFDWRWLAQTIRYNMRICAIHRFPLQYLPTALSTSVFIVAEPR
jgi:SAM-dependent methyltransferase